MRQQIKGQAQSCFKANYWNAVVAVALLTVTLGYLFSFKVNINIHEISAGKLAAASSTSGIGSLIGIFVGSIVEVGICRFFINNTNSRANLDEVFSGFRDGNYPKNLVTMFLKRLFTFLWMLLFIVPGIVKSYSYFLTPYLLNYTDLEGTDAIKVSSQIMYGHKLELFKLHLSFIGWFLLSVLTFGILAVFWTSPYVKQAEAIYAQRLLAETDYLTPVENNYSNTYSGFEPY